jgi:hypothetical protein
MAMAFEGRGRGFGARNASGVSGALFGSAGAEIGGVGEVRTGGSLMFRGGTEIGIAAGGAGGIKGGLGAAGG